VRPRDAERTFQALAAVRYRVVKDSRRGVSRAQAHAVRHLHVYAPAHAAERGR
jgi:hypothetical protein